MVDYYCYIFKVIDLNFWFLYFFYLSFVIDRNFFWYVYRLRRNGVVLLGGLSVIDIVEFLIENSLCICVGV